MDNEIPEVPSRALQSGNTTDTDEPYYYDTEDENYLQIVNGNEMYELRKTEPYTGEVAFLWQDGRCVQHWYAFYGGARADLGFPPPV